MKRKGWPQKTEDAKIAARIVFKSPDKYSHVGAKRIASWLRRQAKLLESKTYRNKLASTFKCTYYYKD